MRASLFVTSSAIKFILPVLLVSVFHVYLLYSMGYVYNYIMWAGAIAKKVKNTICA